MPLLSEFISLKKRYHRSTNLDRDLDRAEALSGYVVTPRSAEALERILSAVTSPGLSRSWTLTGAYGTGKSSFAHFFLSLCGQPEDEARKLAVRILGEHREVSANLVKLAKKIGVRGSVRAVATAQREPISHTVVKALYRGAVEFWPSGSGSGSGRRPAVVEELREFIEKLKSGKSCDSRRVIDFATEIANKAKTGLVIVIDELGKGLEYAALHQADGDLFLLQQLAELKAENGIYVIGLLHQAFAEYGQSLSSMQRQEWSKIQGRFEDIPFTNSASEALRLISHAIEFKPEKKLKSLSEQSAKAWHKELSSVLPEASYTVEMLSEILPLHPIAAIVLPLLCNRFAQNDRSLFSFLTSDEPFSFMHFLRSHEFDGETLPTLKLESLYDYFVDVVGANIYSRPHLSRWLEIQGRISESTGLDSDELRVLKSIGILNLIASAGSLRASQNLLMLAMCDSPNTDLRWRRALNSLIEKRVVAHRRQLDELRVWEGSDFNIEQAIQLLVQSDRRTLDEILNQCAPLGPVVAQRHSYKTGTFRYFERRYVSDQKQLESLRSSGGADGVIAYWVADQHCREVPSETADGKPLVVISASNVSAVRNATHELFALQRIAVESPELQTDGVARREVRQRSLIARRHLDDVLGESFELRHCNHCWSLGKKIKFKSWRDFVSGLSSICDEVYSKTPVLINELINRRELTSQGAKARNELLDALIKHHDKELLGLSGFGPEVSMYRSVLASTGIHRECGKEGGWEIGAPKEKTLLPAWMAIEDYCLESVESARPVSDLFELLSKAPFGLKSGVLPVLFAAVLIEHNDDVCLYRDATFVPILGPEHFELLVKDPARFSVKHFVTTGLRAQVFKEIEELVSRGDKAKGKTRNASLLSVVKPLIQFVNNLPQYTKKTSNLNEQARAIRDAISAAKQPDEMLFSSIPEALGLTPIVAGDKENQNKARELRSGLLSALRELQTAYDEMLNSCHIVLCREFKVEPTSCRQVLRTRGLSVALSASRGSFDSFVSTVIDDEVDDRTWLTRVLMIIGDRPTESWRDEDVELFTSAVGAFAKRFSNFESLQTNLPHSPGEGYEPKKITLTQPSGKEDQKILWIELAKEQAVNQVVDEIIKEKLSTNPELHDAILSKLTERLLTGPAADQNSRRKEA